MDSDKENNMGVLATFRALRNVSGYALWGTAALMFIYLVVLWYFDVKIPEAAKAAIYLTNGVLMTVGALNIFNEQVDAYRHRREVDYTAEMLENFSFEDQRIIVNLASLGHVVSEKSDGNAMLLGLVDMGIYKISEYDPRDSKQRLFVMTELGREALLSRFVPSFTDRDENINRQLAKSLDSLIQLAGGTNNDEVAAHFEEIVEEMKGYFGGRHF